MTLSKVGDRMEMDMAMVSFRGLGVSVWLHTEKDPPEAAWNAAVASVGAWMGARSCKLSDMRHLVVSDGGAPNTRQRTQLHREVFGSEPAKLAVVTTVLSNPIKRGIATALHWMNPSVAFFVPGEVDGALGHLDLGGDVAPIWKVFATLQARLPPIVALDTIARTVGLLPFETMVRRGSEVAGASRSG